MLERPTRCSHRLRVIPVLFILHASACAALALFPCGRGVVCTGVSPGDEAGWSVARAGDFNGDGIADLIIGAHRGDPDGRTDAGECYIVFGKATSIAGLFPASFSLSTLDGTNGFVIKGINAADFAGIHVSTAGDVNGDGVDDVSIGAVGVDPGGRSDAGATYVVFGRVTAIEGPFAASFELSTLDGTSGFVVHGIDAGDRIGRVSGGCDLNDDGVGDLIIGAPFAAPGGRPNAGETYVLFGRNTALAGPFAVSIDLTALDGANGFVINGVDAGDFSGGSISGAGDVNGDGIDDLVIGAIGGGPAGQTAAGESYVVFGRSTGFAASLDLSALDGTNGFVVHGIDHADNSGRSVSSAGDVNGDGVDDLIVGALFADPDGRSNAGESYVIFGKSTGFAASLDLSALDGTNGFVVNGIDASDFSGSSVSGVGDFNGDGIDDLIIGAAGAALSAGESYVVFGRSTGFAAAIELADLHGEDGVVLRGFDSADNSGDSVSGIGDFNGDGLDDLIIGARLADPGGLTNAGETYVVFGRTTPPCAGDINCDRATTAADFAILAGRFGTRVAPYTSGDLNGDGVVSVQDFQILAGDMGCVPP